MFILLKTEFEHENWASKWNRGSLMLNFIYGIDFRNQRPEIDNNRCLKSFWKKEVSA